jgi:hypothetical protein
MGQVIYHFAFLHFSLVIGLRCHWAWGSHLSFRISSFLIGHWATLSLGMGHRVSRHQGLSTRHFSIADCEFRIEDLAIGELVDEGMS